MKYILFPLRLLCAAITLLILYINISLYHKPKGIKVGVSGYLNIEVLEQLQFLKRAIHEEKADEAMQIEYPEGFVFLHALYALAWCDIVANLPTESVSWQEGISEIGLSIQALDSRKATDAFNLELDPSYGAFYQGWSTYLRGRALALLPAEQRDTVAIFLFQERCKNIARAISKTDQPYLASYPGQTWPADNMLCLAALSIHDRLFEPHFSKVREVWLTKIKNTLSLDELVPHSYDLASSQPQGSRGASMALSLCFLAEIDSAFARIQYQKFRQHFLTYRLGIPGIREYPKGIYGSSDIDSGPIVMGIGGAASIVGIRVMGLYGDGSTCNGLLHGVEALLWPRRKNKEKQYLWGEIPILDAFMAWSQAPSFHQHLTDDGHWRWECHSYSGVLLLFMGLVWWRFLHQ